MRTLFFLLMLANVAYFAFDAYSDVLFPGESQLLQQQINPETIKLLATAEGGRSARRGKATCVEWGGFADAEAARAEAALAPLALGAKLAQRRVEETGSWWVFFPPQGSRQAATVKTAELKRLGIEDFFIVQDDPKYRYAVSLGIFRTQEAASNYLEQLRAKGVRTAQAGARETQPPKTWLQVRDPSETVAAKLNELRQGFPGSEVRDCAAEEKKG
jgi:hypothetical protein